MWIAEASDELPLVEGSASTMVLLAVLISWIVVLIVAYWVIRLAVRHALRDASARSAPPTQGQR
jgi:hypothetical protein